MYHGRSVTPVLPPVPQTTVPSVRSTGAGEGGDPLPRRASDLFEGESCAWTEYYGDMETLEFVNEIYALDYSHFRWYQLGPWKERLKGCLN